VGDTVLDLDVRPSGWCYRCGCKHEGFCPVCWADPSPLTANDVAWSAYARAIDDMVGDRPASQASPEALDILAHRLASQAEHNRQREATDAPGGAR
jgi:hypothetical protein